MNNDDRDRRVLDLYERVLEIEQRLIPTGLHIFGQSPDDPELGDLLRMVASFDRPELGIRSLPDLVAEGLGFADYATLLKESAGSEERLREREKVEAIVREAITRFLEHMRDAGIKAAVSVLSGKPQSLSRNPVECSSCLPRSASNSKPTTNSMR